MLGFISFLLQFSAGSYAQEWVSAGSLFTEQLVYYFIFVFAVFAVAMQVSRGYFLRVLRKFTLRLAADIWWIVFILLRAAAIFLVLFLGVSIFWPGTYEDYAIGMPFMPLGIDFFSFALVLLLLRDTDEDQQANRWLTLLLTIGAALITISVVFVSQNPAQLVAGGMSVPTVSTSTGNPWGILYTYFDSVNNPTISIYSFYITFILLGLAGGRAVGWSYEQWALMSQKAQPAPQQK